MRCVCNNNNNCLKSNIQCIEIRVQWTMLVCICVEFAEICCCVTVSGCVSMLVV